MTYICVTLKAGLGILRRQHVSEQERIQAMPNPRKVDVRASKDTPQKRSPRRKKKEKTYNSRDSPVVTHLTTNLPVTSLCIAERTRDTEFWYLWSYVLGNAVLAL
ncbi:hypothetical protein ACJQWK_10250 [Exserohilum turcicum]